MYEIRPETVKTFVLDKNIKLPRFQRKQTWDEKKNFQLCISLFKEYPMGVTILSVEEKNNKTIRWLLDGRQRKNALLQMYEDPENIYNWAKKFIGFKNNSQPSELEEMFINKINEYIEFSDEDEQDKSEDVQSDDNSEGIEVDETSSIESKGGLDFLLEIIKIIHNKNQNSTGFTKPFDITKYVNKEKLSYCENESGISKLSSKKLKTFLDEYRNNFCNDNDLEYEKADSFLKFIESRCDILDKNALKKYISEKWSDMLLRMSIIERLDNLLSNSKIGLIEVKNLSPADSQKIFNIINSEGEKLTTVEVLSAKPSWNVKIDDAPLVMQDAVKELYQKIGTNNIDIVKWDLPATLLKRIGHNFIIKEFPDEPKAFAKEITYGFKLIAGIWENGVKKEDIEKLSKDNKINWSYDFEALVNDIKTMLKLVNSYRYFKFFNSWRANIMDLTSDSIALNFFILLYNDWVRKEKPIGSDTKAHKFEKNCFILWDKLIYEYIAVQWRGSGDTKIASNISSLKNDNDIFTPITTEKWIQLLEEIRDNEVVFGNALTSKNMTPLLYHFYCLKSISGPDTAYNIEVDHILPQDLFKNSVFQNKDSIVHSIFNLGLLPKNDNISKGKKKLIEISDMWLKDQIEKFEFVTEGEYGMYSDITNYKQIYEQRFELFRKAFDESRTYILQN